ncbi:MAG: hypothetical protein JKY01_04190 [Pseudomonadales bacterium]|nr:hypothetical protein [Pseudomonadales bacterium]
MNSIRSVGVATRNSYHDLLIAFVTALSAWVCLFLDTDSSLFVQNSLGVCAWAVLLFFLLFETRLVQAQILVAVAFATSGEYFASVYMEGYTYRLSNVPAFVPPGHGLVYLTAVALGRSPLFTQYRSWVLYFAVISGSIWALWGFFYAEQKDACGALLFSIFLVVLYFGRSTMVYLGAYYITSYLEWVGTLLGTWQWAAIDPVLGLTQGNPPSGVATWYCLVDVVALSVAPLILKSFNTVSHWQMIKAFGALERMLFEFLCEIIRLIYERFQPFIPVLLIPEDGVDLERFKSLKHP